MQAAVVDYVLPSPDLQPFLGLFYRFHSHADRHEDVERAQWAQLRFQLSPGPGSYLMPDGTEQVAPPFHLLGPSIGPVRARATGPLLVFGVGLTPVGWSALLGSDASAMVNRVVDATALFGDEIADAAIGLRNACDVAAMAAAAEPLLRRLIGGEHGPTLAFVRAVDAWLAESLSLDALAERTGLSRRQIERRCNLLYGSPPKLLARKYRALRAAVLLASGEDHRGEGFYDQSHMIREVKAFTGLTPRRLREDPGALARLTIPQRRAFAGRAHRLISET